MTVVSLLDRPVYLYSEVDQIVRLQPGTARRWINGYRRAGVDYEPILRLAASDSEWVTWGEYVETRILSEFRDKKVRTVRLRAAVEHLREMYGVRYPLAHLRPYLEDEGGELMVAGEPHDEAKMIARTGQMLIRDGRALMSRAAVADDQGERVASEMPADNRFPGIVVNPQRLGGKPTFVGRRVAVATIAGMAEAGERREDLAAGYGLSLAQIDEAVEFAKVYKLSA